MCLLHFPPDIDEATIAYSGVDLLIQGNRIAIACLSPLSSGRLEKGLVVGILVLLPATVGQSEIGELDISTSFKQDVVRLDVLAYL